MATAGWRQIPDPPSSVSWMLRWHMFGDYFLNFDVSFIYSHWGIMVSRIHPWHGHEDAVKFLSCLYSFPTRGWISQTFPEHGTEEVTRGWEYSGAPSRTNLLWMRSLTHAERRRTNNLKRLGVSAMCGSSHACNSSTQEEGTVASSSRSARATMSSGSVGASEQHPTVRTIKPLLLWWLIGNL